MKRNIFKSLALSLLAVSGALALAQCKKTSTSGTETVQGGNPDYTLTIAASDFPITSGGEGGGIEKDGFTITMDYWEINTKLNQIQLADTRSDMIFPRLDKTHKQYSHYYGLSFNNLNNNNGSLIIYEVDGAGTETDVTKNLSNLSAHFDSNAVGLRLANNGKGAFLFTSVTLTISYAA
jgi:hypothetical protein